MRRNDKAITDNAEIASIIQRSQVCRVAMCDGNQPYMVPMCFALLDGSVYLHSATEGRKLEILRANPRVCVEFDIDQEVVPAPVSCRISMRYRSVVGFGRVSFINDLAEKRRGLTAIVRQYAEMNDFPDEALAHVTVLRIDFEELTGKVSGYSLNTPKGE